VIDETPINSRETSTKLDGSWNPPANFIAAMEVSLTVDARCVNAPLGISSVFYQWIVGCYKFNDV